MEKNLAQEAILCALNGDWKKAIEINLKILEENPQDVDALNRLARAQAELGFITKARSTALKVLKIDPFNPIATKSLEKWKKLKKGETYQLKPLAAEAFLEEPGKTKVVSLIHLGSPRVIAKLDSSDEAKLNTHSHRVYLTTIDGKYIGKFPDDVSARIRKLIKLGYSYSVLIKSVTEDDVKVFIRETNRPSKYANLPSFPGEKINYVTFTPPELVHEKTPIENPDEETSF